MRERIANAVLFQLGWLDCVLGGNSFWLTLALAALAQDVGALTDVLACPDPPA